MAKAKRFFRKRSSVELTLYEELDWEALEADYTNCRENHSHQLSGGDSPDWADLLAAQWMDAIKATYSQKGLTEKVHAPIVNTQGQAFATGINGIYGEVDFDSPDYYMREVLKKNTWQFSVAKNYNDQVRLNNLLLKEDGSLRPWSDFKYEAQKVVGDSMRYLKTEYNTIVAGAQMSRLWAEIQRDKHIFPYVQILVVQDGRTSDICEPLHNLIFEVDDPVLMYYFPPNHFNCRTTVRKLRYGVPSSKYELPDIPEAFRNNVGATGKIFTDDNKYIENTPDEVLLLAENFQGTNQDYEVLKKAGLFNENMEDLKERIKKAYPNIDLEKINAVNMYSGYYYGEINNFNRGLISKVELHPDHGITEEFYKALTRTINKALDEIPDKFTGTVYRGASLSRKQMSPYFDALKNNKPYKDKAFMSTSYSKKEAFDGNVNFVIQSKKGTMIEKVSEATIEKEVLFKAGQEYKVIKIDEFDGDIWQVYLEEI